MVQRLCTLFSQRRHADSARGSGYCARAPCKLVPHITLHRLRTPRTPSLAADDEAWQWFYRNRLAWRVVYTITFLAHRA